MATLQLEYCPLIDPSLPEEQNHHKEAPSSSVAEGLNTQPMPRFITEGHASMAESVQSKHLPFQIGLC